jgi:hypothetical protein
MQNHPGFPLEPQKNTAGPDIEEIQGLGSGVQASPLPIEVRKGIFMHGNDEF